MTPKFSRAVDPIFDRVLRLLDRIEGSEDADPDDLRRKLKADLDRAEGKLGQSPEWRLAKYALVCWIDEMLVFTDWHGSGWWMNNVLEFEMFESADRYHLFYQKAQEAGALPTRDALEVYFLAVVLGFRGLYAESPPDRARTESLGLPATLADWARQTARGIYESPVPPIDQSGQVGYGAPPLEEQAWFITSSMVAAVLAGLVTVALAVRMGWVA